MHLVEILLPVRDNDGRRFGEDMFSAVRQHLTDHFGGVTAFMRAPAHGTNESNGTVQHDDIVIFEVMTDTLERKWWATYRRELERRFAQDEIVIRASAMERL
jgi:hypothetical protein